MCFYNEDGDWSVSVETEEQRTADKLLKCCECGEPIEPGQEYHYRFQQEHESCHRCEEGDCECIDWEEEADYWHDCKCEKPDYGESWSGNTCMNCRRFLEGVEAHEKAEGCRPYESRPLPGNMIEQMEGFDDDQIKEYFEAAEKLHPDLRASGYLDRLWSRMPVEA